MSGLRIFHPSEEIRSCIVTVPLPPKTDRGSSKEIRVEVDDSGHALVSEGVWEELMFAKDSGNNAGFIIVNEVADPPEQVLGVGDTPTFDSSRKAWKVEQDAMREIAPVGTVARVVQKGLPPSV